jgi:hypothetical protein
MRNVIKLGTNIEHLPQLYVEFKRKIKIRRSEKMESILVVHLLYFIRKDIIFRKGMEGIFGIQWAKISGTPNLIENVNMFPSIYFNGLLPSSTEVACNHFFVFRGNFSKLFQKGLRSFRPKETTSRSFLLMKLFVSPTNASRFFSAPCFCHQTYTDISDGRTELRSYVKKRSGNAVELVHDSNRLRRVMFSKDLVSADVPYLADLSHLFVSSILSNLN